MMASSPIKVMAPEPLTDYRSVEAVALCKQVGITEDEAPRFQWFIDQMIDCPLPTNFLKEVDPSGNLFYINTDSMEIQKTHPLISQFRGMFYSRLK